MSSKQSAAGPFISKDCPWAKKAPKSASAKAQSLNLNMYIAFIHKKIEGYSDGYHSICQPRFLLKHVALLCITISLFVSYSLQAQCDTIPVSNFYPFSFNINGGGFQYDNNFDSRAQITPSVSPIPVGGEVFEVHVGADGTPKTLFNGAKLYLPDGTELAGGRAFGNYTRFGTLDGTSYSTPVIVPDTDTNIIHLFYGALGVNFENRVNYDLFRRPAWYARYHIAADTLQVIDSILHLNAAEGWVGLKANDEESWWLINRVSNPPRAIAYRFRNGQFDLPVMSRLPNNPVKRSTHYHTHSFPTVNNAGNRIAWSSTFHDSIRILQGGGGLIFNATEVANFNCSTGQVENYQVIDSMYSALGLTNFSPSGRYFYYQLQPDASFIGSILYRYDLFDPLAVREMIGDSLGNSVWRGPDDRLYTINGLQGNTNGYIDYPDRWTSTNSRPDGMGHQVYPQPGFFPETSNFLHRPLVDLQNLRIPTAQGPNLVDCSDTSFFTITENCFYNAAGITLTHGPGIELVNRVDADFQLAFDQDSTLSPIRYVALANEHPCRTYRDTVWMFVENCDGGCQPQQTSEAVSVCDSSLVHGKWRDTSGTYAQTFMSFGGCDSTSIVELTINTSVETAEAINACDSVQIEDVWITEDGDYPTIYATSAGCDSTHVVSVSLQTTPLQLQLPTDTTIATLALLEINADSLAQFAFQWTPPSAVDCEDCSSVEVVAGFAGRLQVDIGEEPCIATSTLNIERENKIVEIFSTPDAFSPNGDGTNDFFEIAVPTGAELLSFEIYNRWGTQVYASSCPCVPNRFGLIQTWDGNERGTPVNPGGFAYIGQIRYADGREELVEGGLVVVR